MTHAGATGAVAEFVSERRGRRLPADVVTAARSSLADTIAVTLAGVAEPVSVAVRDTVLDPQRSMDLPCTVVGTPHRATAWDAAFVNGAAAHALDYDDTQANVRGHPSAPVVSAALAAAELVAASGLELLEAIAVGVEVAGKVGRSLGASHAAAGFHATSTLGVLGAAGAACSILGATAAQAAHALGIAASSAGGLRLNFGSMTKPVHVANAARDGVLAALLAKSGVTSALPVLEGPRGFCATFSPGGDADVDAIAELGAPWEIVDPGLAVKMYPCCNRASRVLDAVVCIVTQHRLAADDIESLDVRLTDGEVDEDGRVGPMSYPRPRDGLQAKFSMPYVVAAAVLDSGVGIASFADAAVHRPEVAELLPRIRVVGVNRDNEHGVVARLRDGRELSATVRIPRGNPRGDRPATWADVVAKLLDCASAVLSPEQTERLVTVLADIAALPDARHVAGAATTR